MTTTVLDIVQDILSAIDSDEVNSIGDTTEAQSATRLVKNVYDNIVDEYGLKSTAALFQLDATGVSTPNVMTLPEGAHSIKWIKYDISSPTDPADYATMLYTPPDAFMDHVSTRSEGTDIAISGTIVVRTLTDRAPTLWTTFDDSAIVFDAYNVAYDTTLQTSKTNCYGESKPTLILDDVTPIALSPRYISLLKNECLAMAQDLWKDGVTPKVEQQAQRARVRSQRTKHIDAQTTTVVLPDYGRKRR
jgi:hypothetical protein